jgi:putative FmdB family regulatory protein
MPIYAYRCDSCGFEKDHLQKLNDPVLTVCPECHHDTYRKQLTAAGLQFKGSGWYVTDFKGNKEHKKENESAPAKTEIPPACQGCPGATACAGN